MSKSHNIVILQRMKGLILLYSNLLLTCYWEKDHSCSEQISEVKTFEKKSNTWQDTLRKIKIE